MGAGESALHNVEIGETYAPNSSNKYYWSAVVPGRFQEQHKVTVFMRDFVEEDSSEFRKLYENGILRLKKLRHPFILKFYASSLTSFEVSVITERAKPLDLELEHLEPIEIIDGLHRIAEAIKFLHGKAGLSHNNIGLSSIFVCADGTWKLGCFECSSCLSVESSVPLSAEIQGLRDPAFACPSDQTGKPCSDASGYQRDMYSFGKLLDHLGAFLGDWEYAKTLLPDLVEKLIATSAKGRLSVDDVLSSALFKSLIPRLRGIPPIVVGRRLAKPLMSRFVVLEPLATSLLLPHLMTPLEVPHDSSVMPLLPLALFKQYLVPELLKIFRVHETAVRLAVLSQFHRYCHVFEKDVLQSAILPELLLGMKDTNEQIVAASFRCLASLVSLLGAAAVTGLSHKKYFTEGRPKHLLNDVKQQSSMQFDNARSILTSSSDSTCADIAKRAARLKALEQKHKEAELRKEARRATRIQSNNLRVTDSAEPGLVIGEATAVDCEMLNGDTGSCSSELPTPSPLTRQSERRISEANVPIDTATHFGVNGDESINWSDWQQLDLEDRPTSVAVLTPQSAVSGVFVPNGGASITQSVKKPATKDQKSRNEGLGTEFDVKALTVTPVQVKANGIDSDWFADMEPKFSRSSAVNAQPSNESKFTLKDLCNDSDPTGDWGSEAEQW